MREVVKLIGDDTADNIVTFLHSNVFVHEQHFARCFYLDVRRFDAYSNTCLERTNYSVNYCENRVLPNMSGHFPHDLHHVQLKLGILSHRSKNRTSDSTAWKLALATEADSQYSRRIPYGMIVDQVKIPGLAFNHNQNTHHPDYILRVSVTALRESGYYDQNIVPLVALLNVVALSVLTFQDSDFFHRALITLNIAFVEMSIRMTADSHLPSVGYQIRLQRILNEWFVILMMLLLEGMLQRLDRNKAVERDFEEIEAECLSLTTWTKQQQEQQLPLLLNRKRGAAGAATASPMPKLVARSPMLQQLGGVYSGSGSVRHKKHNSLDATPFR
ncbi:hypothetical protein IV203_028282 [Nitzschia inconspicua]|uniref:Uncharacterized protein n=1 Tax=Nitzschia inconspicua TaxID=303405 RepID=A0A9K3PAJ3_9STRA|nr:hypothetical protein IV203_028282 [Nitzschia inconspicua]